jgi:predicted alpha/beta superfamily hydrolase
MIDPNNYLQLKEHYIATPDPNDNRRIRVLLPTDYDKAPDAHYQVLYMLDGQNIFYSKESFSHYSWKIIPILKYHFQNPKIIIVGIDNAGDGRYYEYTPWETLEAGEQGGGGFQFADWLTQTVKPFIDQNYRTKPEREHTGIAGSSLGGIMAAFLGARHADTFGMLGVFSSASFLSEIDFQDFIHEHPLHPETRVYIQTGTQEGNDADSELFSKDINQAYIDSALLYYRSLIESGHPVDNIEFRLLNGEHHSEKYWANHFGEFLEYIFLNQKHI